MEYYITVLAVVSVMLTAFLTNRYWARKLELSDKKFTDKCKEWENAIVQLTKERDDAVNGPPLWKTRNIAETISGNFGILHELMSSRIRILLSRGLDSVQSVMLNHAIEGTVRLSGSFTLVYNGSRRNSLLSKIKSTGWASIGDEEVGLRLTAKANMLRLVDLEKLLNAEIGSVLDAAPERRDTLIFTLKFEGDLIFPLEELPAPSTTVQTVYKVLPELYQGHYNAIGTELKAEEKEE